MAVKRNMKGGSLLPEVSTKTNIWTVIAFVALLAILMLVLIILQKKDVSQVDNSSSTLHRTPPPQVIVVDKSGGSQLPIYPKNLPQYSSPNRPLDYQQIGILTSDETDKEPTVLPLYGRKIQGRSDRWQYYTATDKNNMIRVPLTYESRDCEDENTGCKEIYSGDNLNVNIYKDRDFTATVYKTEAPHYFAEPY
jgi:hypothetical protein